ncbi:MAG TPA: Crp/Fnr family transcriptional regulator [Bacteroidales bacterium]|nr:Crp/Fnr family transcriptional regulator [Bacteroidales bacterium]
MSFKNHHIEICLDGPGSIFKDLARKEQEIIIQNHSYAHYRKGEIIFKEGEKPPGLISLASGKVKVFKEGVGGREQILRMVKPAGLLGYRALFAGMNYSASAIALEDSTICIIEKDAFFSLVNLNPELSLKIIKQISFELGFSNNRTVSLTQKHIRGRLAESLIVLRDTYGFETDGMTLKAYLSREDIANLSNMTTSNAIRTLSTFASEEVIALDGRKIKILDSGRLERISALG